MFVPVVDSDNKPLMPTRPSRARRWINSGKATPFWKQGIWCVRLNSEPSARNTQVIVAGVDPGSKREGVTVKSNLHTYINIHTYAVDWVKHKMQTRKQCRKARRQRKTPYRKPRWKNRAIVNRLSPSSKSRWQWKLRILRWLNKIFPIQTVIIEDVVAKKSSKHFSAVMVGKNWFYKEINKQWNIELISGFQTFKLREKYSLNKRKEKLTENFESHCVDSWVMANSLTNGHNIPDNKIITIVEPIRKYYRQLHLQIPNSKGVRRRYGGTRSCGFERGSIVKHPKYGECLIGGYSNNGRVSLHCRKTNKRLCRNAKPEEILFKSFNSFLVRVIK